MLNINYGPFVPETDLDNLYSLVIPHSGHTVEEALNDLLDNCFDASAKSIIVELAGDISLESYLIIDNGRGMDINTLKGALTYSAGSIHEFGDLGKFSIGGTTACCTLGLSRRVYTKQSDGPLLVGIQDFRNVTTGTQICQPTPEEKKWFSEKVGKHGTIVEIYDLRSEKLQHSRIGDLKNSLLKGFSKTFYQMLSSKRSIEIQTQKGKWKVKPSDPLLYKTDREKVLSHKTYEVPFDGGMIYVRTSCIDTDKLEHASKGYELQGIYFLRNNRLITSGMAVKDLWKKNPRKNSGRVEISFNEDMDGHFGLTATKNKVSLSQSLVDTLANTIKPFVASLEEKWRKNTDVVSSKIEEENMNFTKKLVHNTGIIDLPKGTAPSKEKQERNKNKGEKKGTVKPKGSGITRSGKRVMVPEFIFQEHRRIPEAFWSEFPDEGGMKIIVNLAHSFIREHWTLGDKTQRELMRKWMGATCLAQFRKKETHHENAAESFMRDMFDELTNIQLALGK